MKINLPQLYFSKLMRAIVEFQMIENGDRILVGVSGGKDSVFLLYALAVMRERLKKDFSVHALTIDQEFSEDFSQKLPLLTAYCESLGIEHEVVRADIASVIRTSDKPPCFTCAFFRRGAMNRYAKEHGLNKIAYAHHNDDAVETFLMSLFYSGQLETFTPVTYLDRTDLTVIRPLVYFRESEMKEAVKYHGFTPIKSPCPFDGHTSRQDVKELLVELEGKVPGLYARLASGMREGALGSLWPAAKTRDEMREIYFSYMGKK